MREGFDREIDSLLRRTARAPALARGNGAGALGADSHLDADELAAFAEGALPEAARMNAVSHLADCGECRALAVNLTRASGVEAELEKRAVAAASPSTERESMRARGWLAALFAPRTLRYVAPALALCLIAAVSFVAIRSRRDGGVAQLERSNVDSRPSIATSANISQPSPEGMVNANASANANTAPTVMGAEEPSSSDKGSAGPAVPKPENKDAKQDAPDGSGASMSAREKVPGSDAEVAAPSPAKEAEDAPAASPPAEVAKSEPAESIPASKSGEHMKAGPPPPAQPSDELASSEASQQSQKRAAQTRNLEPQSPDGSLRGRSNSAANNAANGGALAGAARDDREARLRRESPPASRRGHPDEGAAADADRTNSVEESRSVAGHRFRREGGAWVDVNYKSSMASTGVRRGTDAYRGLVADIPELGRVAEQLGGEVIVVVRGRAYRIR